MLACGKMAGWLAGLLADCPCWWLAGLASWLAVFLVDGWPWAELANGWIYVACWLSVCLCLDGLQALAVSGGLARWLVAGRLPAWLATCLPG